MSAAASRGAAVKVTVNLSCATSLPSGYRGVDEPLQSGPGLGNSHPMKRTSSAPRFARPLGLALLAVGLSACESEKPPEKKAAPSAAEKAIEPAPVRPREAPTFSIDEAGPQVGFSRSMLTGPNGAPNGPGLEQFKTDLGAERSFIEGKEVALDVHRMAKPEWVSTYVEELGALGASAVRITTETRSDYPKIVPFIPASRVEKPAPCTVVGSVTADRGTAVWKVSGGTARKRGRGMGGPDFTITGDTLKSMLKACESELFVVHGAEGVEWGLLYDFAASALALESSPLKRAAVPSKRPVPGRPVALDR